MYLMNFLFDMSNVKGVFSGDRLAEAPPPPPDKKSLYTSPNWLELIGPKPPSYATGEFDPDTREWTDLGEMDTATLLISQAAVFHDLGIRIAGDPTGLAFDKNKPAALKLSVCFGRPSHTRQNVASPLKDAAGGVLTTIVEVAKPPTGWLPRKATPSISDPYWYFHLGEVKLFPQNPRRSHRYQYSVGIIVSGTDTTGAAHEHHYSHDPEMDVTT
jgi:hypothetical protein